MAFCFEIVAFFALIVAFFVWMTFLRNMMCASRSLCSSWVMWDELVCGAGVLSGAGALVRRRRGISVVGAEFACGVLEEVSVVLV